VKNLFLIFTVLAIHQTAQSQCPLPYAVYDLHSNNIKARIYNGGDLFTVHNFSQFVPNPSSNPLNDPGTLYGAGLWIGGLDAAGNINIAAMDERDGQGYDYSAGPLDDSGVTDLTNCQRWDRQFRVTAFEIANFLEALPLSQNAAIAQFPSIMGWPGKGNGTFANIWGFDLPVSSSPLAPFVDADGNGIYNPLNGDYPAVLLRGMQAFVPAEMIWTVINDQNGGAHHYNTGGKPLQIEVHQMAWAFNCIDEPVLNNTIFISHKIFYKASEVLDSCYVGYWIDFDLGCYMDDYVGCDPNRSSMYVYNMDADDGIQGFTCNGVSTFADKPPVQTVTFLGNSAVKPFSLDKFIAYYTNGPNGTQAPNSTLHYYNYLKGNWRNGAPLTYGGIGFGGITPTNHAFPSNPSDPQGWSMCSSGLAADNRRVIGSHKLGKMYPGSIFELTTAWAVHFNTPPPCNLGNALNEVDVIRAHHDNGYAGLCSSISKAPELPADSILLFPNPSNGTATLRYGSIQVDQIKIYDPLGQLIEVMNHPKKSETTLELRHLPAGVYQIQLYSDSGVATRKMVVAR
jgi:hypothetical protein